MEEPQARLSRQDIADAGGEFLKLVTAARSLTHRIERAAGKPDSELLIHGLLSEATVLADMLRFAVRYWQRMGHYVVWYEVSSGALHATLSCSTIAARTPVRVVAELAGECVEDVVRQGHRVCGHCRKRSRATRIDQTTAWCQRWITRLQGMEANW